MIIRNSNNTARRKGVKKNKVVFKVKRTPARKAMVNILTNGVSKQTIRRKVNNLRRMTGNPRLRGMNTATNMKRPQLVKDTTRMSPAGLNFLKCAFAPPDFSNTQVVGVPDNFRGNSLLKKHRYTTAFTFAANNDYYFILAPVPGVSFFQGATIASIPVASTATFNATNYSDFTTLFPTINTAANIVTQFRYISNHFEMISTTNDLNWSGMISVFKIPLTTFMRVEGASTLNDLITIAGLNGINTTNAPMYTGNFKSGAFVGAYNASSTFGFNPIWTDLSNLPPVVDTGDFGQLVGSSFIPGFDNNFESVVIKISGITATETCLIKTWSCVEYKPAPNSSISEYATASPPEDCTALDLYREIALTLPIAVPASMNAGIWERVLRIIRNLSAYGSLLPGPAGLISSGVNLISGGISEMVL